MDNKITVEYCKTEMTMNLWPIKERNIEYGKTEK